MTSEDEVRSERRRKLHWSLAILTLATVPLYGLGLAMLVLAPTAAAAAAQPTRSLTPAAEVAPPLPGSAAAPTGAEAARAGLAPPSTAPDPAAPDDSWAADALTSRTSGWVLVLGPAEGQAASPKDGKGPGKGRGRGRGKR
jgi:hypothetical protein